MALCPNCHGIATAGAMPEAEQRGFKANPFNLSHGYAGGQIRVLSPGAEGVLMGSNRFIDGGLSIEHELVVLIEANNLGGLVLSAQLFNREDDLVATVVDNEWVCDDPLPWDLSFSHQVLKINSAPHKISLEIDASGAPVTLKGELWRKGQRYTITPSRLVANGETVRDIMFQDCFLRGQMMNVGANYFTMDIYQRPRRALRD